MKSPSRARARAPSDAYLQAQPQPSTCGPTARSLATPRTPSRPASLTTDAIKAEGNVLAVACYEYSSASWLRIRTWRLHGLFRSVELSAFRPCRRHIHADTDWDPPHLADRSRWTY